MFFSLILVILVLIAGMTFFTGCGDDDENDGMDDTILSNKEIVVKMAVYTGSGEKVNLELDGNWVEDEIIHYNEEYTLYLTNWKSLPYPKDLVVDWGDGTETSSTSHEYITSGTYQITLKCKELRSLYVEADLTDIDLSQAVDLEYLMLEERRGERRLKDLDVSRNKKLKVLHYSEIDAPFADVTNNTQLMYLDCSDRGFDGDDLDLDFSKNTALRYLACCWSGLKSLNIKGCKELIYLNAGDCDLSDEAANQVYRDLPQGKTWKNDYETCSSTVWIGYYDRYGDGQWHNSGDISIAMKKGWNKPNY